MQTNILNETCSRNGQSNSENRTEKLVVLLGESIAKNINGYELSN